MASGVSRRWVRPLILARCPADAWSAVRRMLAATGWWELSAVHLVVGRQTLSDVQGPGSGCEYLIAQVPQRVVAAAGELAGDR
jgi:hypothetical protein